MPNKIFYPLLGLISLSAFTIDMVSKSMILKMFNREPYPISESVSVWGNFFRLTYVQNFGITFGLFSHFPKQITFVILLLTSCVALGVLIYFFKNVHKTIQAKAVRATQIALALILGGAMGNITDRLMNGFVVDFLDFGTATYRWYTFNFADVFIVSGCILLGIILLFFEIKEPKTK